ncbi:long-chain fatty acid--CoA ligase [Undibacterium sp.]|uniref:AMP-dependent synthetase/ligase n=1 Tax=Undibacterium sp. TaxID=1914977 RepID=UPI002B5BAAA5|nr:long-chain fatty acid--CoA ligase [Undibacterium sp.]HTD06978.1 long-chain fatty acid--CoA ligase [Undibacterium sp.]
MSSNAASINFISAPARFLATARRLGSKPAYFIRDQTAWQPTNWADYAEQVQAAARALLALGVQKGDAVCILGFNRPEWVIMDIAAMMVGAVAAGIYWTSAPEEIEYIVNHSGCAVMLVEDDVQYAKLAEKKHQLDKLQHVVLMRGTAASQPGQIGWEQFLAMGTQEYAAELTLRIAAIHPQDLGTLIYTSGTTGPSKAVMLSHNNLGWATASLCNAIDSRENDRMISYLPLAHIAEQLGSIHNHIYAGYPVYFANSMESLGEHLREVRPTIFFGVPRVWEKMHATIAAKLAAASGIKAALARWAMRTGRRWHALDLAGQKPGAFLSWQKQKADKLIYSKIKEALGFQHARILISAAAPIALENLEFFSGLDLVIREVYGQSEDCGPTSISAPGHTRLGSVGKPLAGSEVRIAEDGEILVRGPHVFQGYMRRPEETAETLQDGWLHSGDLGHFDADGFLYVTGRKKDLLITSGGKNISPANIEAALMSTPMIEHAIVCGDGKHFLTALLTLKGDAVTAFAREHELQEENLAQHPQVLAEVQRAIDDANAHHARVAAIRKFTILNNPLSVDTGELTATMKIKRKTVIERNRQAVAKMYETE